MRAGWLLAALTPLSVSATAGETTIPWPTGLYSNVASSEQTGDLGGLEARFYEEEGGRHMAEFVLCEGWCNETHISEVVREGQAFGFGFVEIFTGAAGAVPVKVRFVVRPLRGGLSYAMYQDGKAVDFGRAPGTLRRTKKPFGIAVAKSGKD
jgi:hypothetical protein